MKQEVIKLTKEQLTKYEVVSSANAGYITVSEAALALGLSERQIKRLKKKVREEGVAAVIHKNTLRTPSHAISQETKDVILELKHSDIYAMSNFKHFQELLSEHHETDISYSSLYVLLTDAGLESPRTKRRFKPHRRRKRRAQAGLLLQTDATPFAWFSDNKKPYALHGAIDDATGQVTGLYMAKNECLHGYYEMLRRTVLNFGIPVSIYADMHTIFQSPNRKKAEVDPSVNVNDTQFGRTLKELKIQLIAARSPQAKGRIEKLWDTLQGRLPTEFAIRGITTIDAANEFLKTYPYAFNSVFAVEPENADNMFHRVPDGLNIDYVICCKEKRVIDDGGVFSFKNRSFKVVETISSGIIPKGSKINVLTDPVFGIRAEYRNIVFEVLPFVPPKRKKQVLEKVPAPKQPVPDSHYFKYGQKFAPKLNYEESDSEIIAMLEKIFLEKIVN
jgi:transposase